MNQADLLALRAQIDAKLTGIKLSDVNLAKETLIQFQQAKILQAEASKPGTDVPMNQRAQVQNSIAGIIDSLSKLQMKLYDSEGYKRLRAAVVKVMRALPEKERALFYEMMGEEIAAAQRELDA